MPELYNTRAEVLQKAMRGLGLDSAALATRSGLPSAAVDALLHGLEPPADVARVAASLGLDAAALEHYDRPPAPEPLAPHLSRLELPFDDETVNVWQIDHPAGTLLIDTGQQPEPLRSRLPGDGEIDLLITHTHRDHIGGLAAVTPRLRRGWAAEPVGGCQPVAIGQRWALGELQIEVLDLAGHHPQAVGYLIEGLGNPLLAVGDALFARSIGGCADPAAYARARSTLVRALRSLPATTTILPGHGPATRLDRERCQNPFLAAWLSAEDAAP